MAENFESPDLDEFNFRKVSSTKMKEQPIYGCKGEPYVPPTSALNKSKMAFLAMEVETDIATEPEEVIPAAKPEQKYLTAEPTEETSTTEPVGELPTVELGENASATESEDEISIAEPTEDASADGSEENKPSIEPEAVEPVVEPEDDATSVEEKEINYYDGVRFTAPDSNEGPVFFRAAFRK